MKRSTLLLSAFTLLFLAAEILIGWLMYQEFLVLQASSILPHMPDAVVENHATLLKALIASYDHSAAAAHSAVRALDTVHIPVYTGLLMLLTLLVFRSWWARVLILLPVVGGVADFLENRVFCTAAEIWQQATPPVSVFSESLKGLLCTPPDRFEAVLELLPLFTTVKFVAPLALIAIMAITLAWKVRDLQIRIVGRQAD